MKHNRRVVVLTCIHDKTPHFETDEKEMNVEENKIQSMLLWHHTFFLRLLAFELSVKIFLLGSQ